MAFLSRLFKRGHGDPLAERERELERAHRQGLRDARQHPLGEFTDTEVQPAYVSEVRAWAKEQIAHLDQELAETRARLVREAGQAQETILRETSRLDLVPETPWRPAPPPTDANADADEPADEQDGGAAVQEDAFITIGESRRRRAERERRAASREAGDTVQRSRARIEQLAQEWDSALVSRNHAVDAIHARAEQRIAAYRAGVMRAHPRKEEIALLWKGEVVAMDSTMDSPTAIAGREALGRLLSDVDQRIEVWRAEQRPPAELGRSSRPELLPSEESRLARPSDYETGNGRAGEWAPGAKDHA